MIAILLAAALAFQDDAAATEAIAAFDATLSKSKDPSARVAAVGQLEKVHHEKVVSRLGNLLTHEDKGLRVAAAHALGTFHEVPELRKSASRVLVSALSSGANQKEDEVRVAIFAALGTLQEESSATAIKSHFDDKDVPIAQAAVSAAGALKLKSMVEPLIELLKDCEKKLKPPDSGGSRTTKPVKTPKGGGGGADPAQDPEAQKRNRAQALHPTVLNALAGLTGQTNILSSDDWEKWWSKNRNSFDPSK
jgi:hypothetical protein